MPEVALDKFDTICAVARKTERVIRDYFVSAGGAGEYTLPKDYEDLVLALESAGLLVSNLDSCFLCPSPAHYGSSYCSGHLDLIEHECERNRLFD